MPDYYGDDTIVIEHKNGKVTSSTSNGGSTCVFTNGPRKYSLYGPGNVFINRGDGSSVTTIQNGHDNYQFNNVGTYVEHRSNQSGRKTQVGRNRQINNSGTYYEGCHGSDESDGRTQVHLTSSSGGRASKDMEKAASDLYAAAKDLRVMEKQLNSAGLQSGTGSTGSTRRSASEKMEKEADKMAAKAKRLKEMEDRSEAAGLKSGSSQGSSSGSTGSPRLRANGPTTCVQGNRVTISDGNGNTSSLVGSGARIVNSSGGTSVTFDEHGSGKPTNDSGTAHPATSGRYQTKRKTQPNVKTGTSSTRNPAGLSLQERFEKFEKLIAKLGEEPSSEQDEGTKASGDSAPGGVKETLPKDLETNFSKLPGTQMEHDPAVKKSEGSSSGGSDIPLQENLGSVGPTAKEDDISTVPPKPVDFASKPPSLQDKSADVSGKDDDWEMVLNDKKSPIADN